ncbi:MAG: hypothetical protein KKG33_12380 [candidate division Zixibacteria bacterium]|nr:hypothetical protein [candidate division Zixibacteria bacterium]MBU1472039.1 hypothetical protein [candidate division Zixibacteria bacterium]MBU2626347.1 hypothetical protein [candidate division Zixibacteria bacterium]
MSDGNPDKRIAIKIVVDGKVRDVSFEELTLSNNLAQEALVRLLISKKIIDPKDLMEAMQTVQQERYKSGDPGE